MSGPRNPASKAFFMPKALSIIVMVVAALLLLVFGLDLAIEFPFQRADIFIDIGMLIGALALAYMSWTTYREVK